MRLTRRDLLLGAAALGLAACGPKNPQARAMELWTLQLAPKFNPYFADVLGDWSRLHPGAPVRWTICPGGRWNASCWRRCLPARLQMW
jgi:putative chitobiose transport system substrate-binding protein